MTLYLRQLGRQNVAGVFDKNRRNSTGIGGSMSRQRASGSGLVGGIGLGNTCEEEMHGAIIDSSMELSLMPLQDNQAN